MSVKVNLLPPEVAERAKARRATVLSLAGVLVFTSALGGAYVMKLGDVAEARDQRDAAQVEVTRLTAEVARLDEFRQLADRLETRNGLLAHAMSREVGWARILNDLSLAFPSSASLTSLTATLNQPGEEPQPGSIDYGDTIGRIELDGYSIERFAPGVEGVLLDVEEAAGLDQTGLNTANTEDVESTEVTAFLGSVRIGGDTLTNRYADGLPKEASR